MIIVGAGMAGLLAANMLARHKPQVIEKQSELPNNHSAVLRFKSPEIGNITGAPFRKVKLIKTYLPWRNRVADTLAYSAKCSGIMRSDRSIISESFAEDRYIAPPDFIARMAEGASIKFNTSFGFRKYDHKLPVISTIPMPVLMKLLDYSHQPEFNYVPGANLRFTLDNCDAFVSLYVPSPDYEFNRISITGDEVIAEYAFPDRVTRSRSLLSSPPASMQGEARTVLGLIGLEGEKPKNVTVKSQSYAKIQPIDEDERKRFLAWATDNYNIFSLGRFATWRPGLLLDDLVQDIRLIEKWATADRYAMRFAR